MKSGKKLIEVAREPDFGVTSVNYDFADLISRAGQPG